MSAVEPVGSIVLAAGPSSRLGRPKQLVQYHGQTLIERVCQAIQAAVSGPIVVVLGGNEKPVRELLVNQGLDRGLELVINEEWENGMGSSIAVGVRYLIHHHPNLSRIIISVCDQPFLSKEVIQELVLQSRMHPDQIVAAGYGGTFGPPVLFPARYADALVKLSGNEGARKIIAGHMDRLVTIDFPKGDFDLDTPEDEFLINTCVQE